MSINEKAISLKNGPARKDFRRNDIGILICSSDGIPLRLIYTKEYEKGEPLKEDLNYINVIEIVKKCYDSLHELELRNESVYLGICQDYNFLIYQQIFYREGD